MSDVKKKFAMDVSMVLVTSIIVYGLRFLTKPLMVRYITPAEVGEWAIIIGFSSLIFVVTSAGIPPAVVKFISQHKNEDKKYAIFSSALVLYVTFGFLTFAVLWALSSYLGEFFSDPALSSLLKVYAFAVPFEFVSGVSEGVATAERRMKWHSFATLSNGVGRAVSLVVLLVLGFGIYGVIAASVMGSVLRMIVSTAAIRDYYRNFKIKDFLVHTKALVGFGYYLVGGALMITLMTWADRLMIGRFIDTTSVGYYAVSLVLLDAMLFIPHAVGKISFPAMAEYHGRGDLEKVSKVANKASKYSIVALGLLGVGMFFFGGDAILLLFGGEYAPSVLPFLILIFGKLSFDFTYSIAGVNRAFGRPDIELKIGAAALLVNVSLNFIFIPIWGIIGAAIATSIGFFVRALVFVTATKKATGISLDYRWFSKLAVMIGMAIPIYYFVYLTGSVLMMYLVGTVYLVVLEILLFYKFLADEDRKFILGYIGAILKKIKLSRS